MDSAWVILGKTGPGRDGAIAKGGIGQDLHEHPCSEERLMNPKTLFCVISLWLTAGIGQQAATAQCLPDPTGSFCEGQCPVPGEVCAPSEITIMLDGSTRITACECATTCHIDLDPATQQLTCVSDCPVPPGGQCEMRSTALADGSFSYDCTCGDGTDPMECDRVTHCDPFNPGSCVTACSGPCPVAGDECYASHLIETGQGQFEALHCDCGETDPGGVCRPIAIAGVVECLPDCPDGTPCLPPVITQDPMGQNIYECPPCGGGHDDTGSCCIDEGGTTNCIEPITAPDCHILNGIFNGIGSTCTPDPCDELDPAEGACCFEEPCGSPTCAVMTQQACHDLGGTYHGNFTTCATVDCQPEVGACCATIDGVLQCVVVTAEECNSLVGVYEGDGTVCGPASCNFEQLDCGVADCCERAPAFVDPDYASFTGAVAVATKDNFGPGPRVIVMDVKNKATAPINTHWSGATQYSDPSWTGANLGTVFGLALDRRGNIYVTASTAYSLDTTAAGGPGAVYKINGISGAITTFASLPNTGPGLGNIAYDCRFNQFFVTNHEDGKIYRLDSTGATLSTFDHGTPDTGAAGFAPLGDRPWGIQVYNGRVYYGLWWEDAGRPSSSQANEVWSIGQNAIGDFAGVAQLEITVPPRGITNYSSPVSDISFTTKGCMLLAERPMTTDTNPTAHNGRVLEYNWTGFTWVPSPHLFDIGVFVGENSAGGIDYDLTKHVWATGDALQFGPQSIYGVQCLPGIGGVATNSVLIDMDGDVTFQEKTRMGDIELPCIGCTSPPASMVGWWPLDEVTGPTAKDIAINNDGTHTNGPTPILGVVDRGLRFDGIDDLVDVPDHPTLDIGTSDFTIDAWVKTCTEVGVAPIVDKREQGLGYYLYLANGSLVLDMSDGIGATFLSGSLVADGSWHLVAVTVDRDQPTGGTFYVDGVAVTTFNPMSISGSLSNSANLYIGASHTLDYFDGEIDEVEIFRRALGASEIFDIYNAERAGKCKDSCHIPWDKSFCIGQLQRNVDVTICNDGTSDYDYNWSLAGVPGVGGVPGSTCNVNGPTIYSPSSGTVTVPAGQCVSITITIDRPAGLTAPNVACYDLLVNNADTGNSFSCRGSVQAKNKWCLNWATPVPYEPVIAGGIGTVIEFEAENTDNPDNFLDYQIIAMPANMNPNAEGVSLDGLPPGEPVVRTVKIPPGEEGIIEVGVRIPDHEPFVFYDIILMYDENDDGIMEAAASASVRSVYADDPGCSTTSDCCDVDMNGTRDDGCAWCECAGASCNTIPITFADMGGAFGACTPDGFANIHDKNHALSCFAGTNGCDALNIDAGGAFGACMPDGFCNIHDANHALSAFAGTTSCSCPSGPVPDMPVTIVDDTSVSLIADRRTLKAGDTVDIRVLLDEPLENLQSYQLHLDATGGHQGRLELVDVFFESRKDAAFAGRADQFDAVNLATSQLLAGLEGSGQATRGGAVLATLRYRATTDARGRFVIDVRHDPKTDQTYLISDYMDQIEVTGTTPAVVTVQQSLRR
jgi:hypothetical protein